jgi:hypothetical protein
MGKNNVMEEIDDHCFWCKEYYSTCDCGKDDYDEIEE